MTQPGSHAPRVVLVGPTATGKSDVAMAAAAAVVGSEIVAVDSMQVYTGMDIGTAKPSAADRVAVVHHGLDLAAPSQRFTVADYVAAVGPVVRASPRALLLVAGTGLYLTALVDGLDLPGEWPALRAELDDRANGDLASLHAELAALDAVAAGRIEPGNRRRLVRALEVCLGSGRPFSSFGPGVDRYEDHGMTMIGLRWDRRALASRIETRVESMLSAGLVGEVEELLARHGSLSPTAGQALGYREVIDHLEGRASLDETASRIAVRTRQFAVRQERWYRRDPRIRWVDISSDPVAAVATQVIDELTE